MQAHRTGRAAAAVTIEGEAVVLERHPGSVRSHAAEAAPTNDNRPEPLFPCRAPPPKPDLVFPGRVRWPSSPDGTAERMASRIGWTVAAGTTLAALAAVALIAASRLAPPAPVQAGFELTETQTAVSKHRNGAVLAVEGRIRNISARAGTPPDVTIRFAEADSGALRRSFRPGEHVLQPGASLFFHSTLALPSATSGAIAVSLVRTAEGNSVTR